jgi:CheY-like chemotaxis protein
MSGQRVLFVEDNVICAMETCEILRDCGYNVMEVHHAADALQVIDSQVQLSALVTDVDLGPGLDGFDVARAARRVHPHLPVVYISGAAAARHPAEGVPGSQFLAKPFHPHQVLEALDRAIRREAA